jgi:hypothetical protein
MIRALRFMPGLALAGLLCAAPGGGFGIALTRAPNPPAEEVEVVRRGDLWTADFRFHRSARAWVFVRSAPAARAGTSWRAASWTVETKGVRLERRGRYDILVAEGGFVPRLVRIRFRPFGADVEASYNPALVFTDRSVALYSDQFSAFPYPSAAGAERLPVDLEQAGIARISARTRFRDLAGPVLQAGRYRPSVTLGHDNDGTGSYVLFGKTAPIVTPDLTAIFDPGLPAWLRAELARAAPAILVRYESEMGPPGGHKLTIIANWRGATAKSVTMSGGNLDGLLAMTFEGEGLLKRSQQVVARNLWFIAHEAAHSWLGRAVRYSNPHESWITEGGADLLAIRAVAAIDPNFDRRAELQREVDDCVDLSRGRGIAGAIERNEFRAYYACGAVFALVAEGASGHPFSAFVRGLVAANRASGIVDRAKWLAALDRTSGDPTLSADIAILLDRGASNPKAVIASLFDRSHVAYALAADGKLRIQ